MIRNIVLVRMQINCKSNFASEELTIRPLDGDSAQ